MNTRHRIISLVISTVSVWFFWGWSVDAQATYRALDTFRSELFAQLSTQPSARISTTVASFCKIASQWPIQWTDMIYDAKQSLWMSILCLHTKNPVFEATNKLHAVKTQRDRDIDCDLNNNIDLESCPIHNDIIKIFGIIINTYSNIKLANLYGMSSIDPWLDDQTLANNRAKQYFGSEFELCGKNCQYPKTYNQLKSTLSNARENAFKSPYIQTSKLSKNPICKPTEWRYDMISCGLLWWGNMTFFTMLLYHELMRYQLFISTYNHLLSTAPSMSKMTTDPLNTISRQSIIAQQLTNELRISQQAISHTLITLNSIQQTYPVHIWLLMYYETLETFRNRLAKIYTPLHQLYYKLRNVQQKES